LGALVALSIWSLFSLGAAAAAASTVSLSFVSGQIASDGAHEPGSLSASGSADVQSTLFVFSQTQPCLDTVAAEMSSGPSGTQIGEMNFDNDVGPGSFALSTEFAPTGQGTFQACGYLLPDPPILDSTPVATATALECSYSTRVSGNSCVPYQSYNNHSQRCDVPRLRGLTLSRAKAALLAAGCRLGRVKGRRGRRAHVVSQSPRPGSVWGHGKRVTVTLGRR
jgi:hypothetical protein